MTNPKPCDKPEQAYRADLDPQRTEPGQTFWMVYVDGRSGPQARHYTIHAAEEEAERLARKEAGRVVYVLATVCYCRVEQAPVVWHTSK